MNEGKSKRSNVNETSSRNCSADKEELSSMEEDKLYNAKKKQNDVKNKVTNYVTNYFNAFNAF